MLSEVKTLRDAISKEAAKAKALKEKVLEEATKNQLFAGAYKHLENKAVEAAAQAYQKALKRFDYSNLSDKSYQFILSLRDSPGICSRCRWQSGCLSCYPNKALRYYVLREAWTAQMVPSIASGQLPLPAGLRKLSFVHSRFFRRCSLSSTEKRKQLRLRQLRSKDCT